MNDLVTYIVLTDASQSKTINRFITLLSLTMVLRFVKFDIWIPGNHRESLRDNLRQLRHIMIGFNSYYPSLWQKRIF